MYTTSDRVTPLRRGPTPPPALDPGVSTRWQSGFVAPPGLPRAASNPNAERERILAEIEMDGILHEIRQDELRRREYAAALDHLRALVGDVALYAPRPPTNVDLTGFPDPRVVLARKQGRTLRLSPRATKKDAAALRGEQLKRERTTRASALAASTNPRDLSRPLFPAAQVLGDSTRRARARSAVRSSVAERARAGSQRRKTQGCDCVEHVRR